MTKRDYYEVLGVARDVAPDQLKKAYRKLAMKYHPDQNPDDDQAADKFKELTEAFQVLSDTNKRARYDRFGHAAGSGNVDFGGGVDVGSMTDFFESIFGSVFGGGGGPRRRRRVGRPGRDLQYDLTLTLSQVVEGADVRITVPRPVRCEKCDGSGAAPGTSPQRCGQCDGIGQVRLQQGIFAVSTTCPACQGVGEVIRSRCSTCGGKGLQVREEELDVNIPAGVDDGAVKIVQGGGEHGLRGGQDGDLHIMVHVEKHELFVRRGQDLLSVVHVTYPEAVLGAAIDIPTIRGETSLEVKPGTESAQVYRIKGEGMPALRGSHVGDQLVHVEIGVPKELTPRQKELIEELGVEFGNSNIQRRPQSLLEKLKNLFD